MPAEPHPKKLLDRVREAVRLKHYSCRTEQTYGQWIRRYILFHNKRHPQELGIPEIEAFLTHVAVRSLIRLKLNWAFTPIGRINPFSNQSMHT